METFSRHARTPLESLFSESRGRNIARRTLVAATLHARLRVLQNSSPRAVGVRPCFSRYSALRTWTGAAPLRRGDGADAFLPPLALAALPPTAFTHDELPRNKPSFLARKRDISTASRSARNATGEMSDVRPRSFASDANNFVVAGATAKLRVSRLIPTPSVIVSNGFRSLFPSASWCVYSTPRVPCCTGKSPAGPPGSTRSARPRVAETTRRPPASPCRTRTRTSRNFFFSRLPPYGARIPSRNHRRSFTAFVVRFPRAAFVVTLALTPVGASVRTCSQISVRCPRSARARWPGSRTDSQNKPASVSFRLDVSPPRPRASPRMRASLARCVHESGLRA